MKKTISGWGRYPEVEARIEELWPGQGADFAAEEGEPAGIARGLGRSYGDSALARTVYSILPRDRLLDFNAGDGTVRCEAGVSLDELLEIFVPRGWFLPVTPGTKQVTVGGAIASDVHGKNHHGEGCFSEYVSELQLMGPGGEVLTCSRQENSELFRATCGGMGLTGIILEAEFKLKEITSSYFDVLTLKASNLEESFRLFEEYGHWPYSVAWLDCLARGDKLGRSLLMVGKNREDGRFDYSDSALATVPFDLPGRLLNKGTISLFNSTYYHRVMGRQKSSVQDINGFFYPLDSIRHWNRMYGKEGFLQYQFVLPKRNSFEGLREILQEISRAGKGSFLSVLKLMGPENENFLSFPMEGYTLSLDFKVEPGIFELLDRLDRRVAEMGGRIYLTKDARMSPEIFEQGYTKLKRFREVRRRYSMNGVFESKQSRRLGI